MIVSLFKRKEASIPDINLENVPLEEKSEIIERPQQSFAFDEQLTPSKVIAQPRSKYKLPAIDYLEKNTSKLSASELNKNRPDGEFMEKILLDFGIDGKIKAINNGPVVSLYEF